MTLASSRIIPWKLLARGALKLLVLGWTAIALLGHAADGARGDCSEYPEQRLEYDVMGDCGPAGTIELVAMVGSCDIWVEGDEVGLPRTGRRQNSGGLLGEGGFALPAEPPEYPRGCTALRKEVEGELTLACGPPTYDPEQNCTAVLRRVP